MSFSKCLMRSFSSSSPHHASFHPHTSVSSSSSTCSLHRPRSKYPFAMSSTRLLSNPNTRLFSSSSSPNPPKASSQQTSSSSSSSSSDSDSKQNKKNAEPWYSLKGLCRLLIRTTKGVYLILAIIPTTMTALCAYHYSTGDVDRARGWAFFAVTGYACLPFSFAALLATPYVCIHFIFLANTHILSFF